MLMTYDAANEWLAKRMDMTTAKKSMQISQDVPAKVRAHAFFSARVAEGHILEAVRGISDRYSKGEMNLADARLAIKKYLDGAGGYDFLNPRLANLASTARINLILTQNARMAAAVGQYQVSRDPDIEERFPCWRYVATTSKNPRASHERYNGMVFKKSDPIWHRIFPPSDFGCKCSVEDCDDDPDTLKDAPSAPSGFQFDPAHAFEDFDYSLIKDAMLREQAEAGVKKRLGPVKKRGVSPEHSAKRKEQLQKAYEKRVAAWETRMRACGLKAEAVSEIKKFYTLEAALNGKPPEIEAAPDIKGAYLSKDGQTLYIGKASLKDVEKALRNLPHTIHRGAQYRMARAGRLKHEAKLIGAKPIRGKHTAFDDAQKTNPHYGENGKAYTNNCQRDITAYEARRRGIDVEALPRKLKPDGSLAYEKIALSGGWASVYQNAKPEGCDGATGKGVRKKIMQRLSKMPDGARCAVQVVYNKGGGHVFIAERHHGKTVFIDPQEPSRTEDMLLNDIAPNNAFVMRLDNLKFNDKVRMCCKQRED